MTEPLNRVTHTCDSGIHFLVFPAQITHAEYDDIFSEAYAILGDLTDIRVVLDLSYMGHINSWFIGIIAEFFTSIEDNGGRMVILANPVLDDIFNFVGFKDFVEVVLERNAAIKFVL